MKKKYFWIIIFIAALIFFIINTQRISLLRKKNILLNGSSSDSLALITEPNDGIAPVLATIRGASTSVDLVIYELDDAQIESALAADEQRGVAVRVILSSGYNGASSTMNGAAYNFLVSHGVPVRWSPAYFSLTHQKTLVVDSNRALIMTFNLVSKYYMTGRDFGIVDQDARDIAAVERTFGDDWENDSAEGASRGGNNGDASDDLLWSPGSEAPLIALIDSAKKSLYIYNEEMADTAITKTLIDAARRGVGVYVDMTGASEWKWEFEELTTAGAHVRTYPDADDAPLYIHAKMIIIDGETAGARAFLGSENFSAGSLNNNRELGIMISDQRIIESLMKTFTADWHGATPFAQ